MTLSEQRVMAWVAANLPNLFDVVPAARVIEFEGRIGTSAVTCFMLEAPYARWSDIPDYNVLVDQATVDGLAFLERVSDQPTWGIFATGPDTFLVSNAASVGSYYGRVPFTSTAFKYLESSVADVAGYSTASYEAHTAWSADVVAVMRAGISGASLSSGAIHFDPIVTNWGAAATRAAALAGPDEVPIFFLGGVTALGHCYMVKGTGIPYGMAIGVWKYDQASPAEVGLVDLRSATEPLTSRALAAWGAWGPVHNTYNAGSFEPPGPSTHIAEVALNAEGDSIGLNWLPLSVPLPPFELLVHGTLSSTEVLNPSPRLRVYRAQCDMIAGAIPTQWYLNNILDGKTPSAEQQTLLTEAAGQSLTFVQYSTREELPVDLVTRTEMYRSYKKAKEKVCEDNDFMEKEFAPDLTYGTLNTMLNGARFQDTFFGYRDSTESLSTVIDPVAHAVGKGVTLTWAAPVLTRRNANGTFGPSLTSENYDEVAALVATGAALSGITLSALQSAWGIDSAVSASVTEDMANEQFMVVNSGSNRGTPLAKLDFDWRSLGRSGYPDYRHSEPQQQYRIAMTSRGVCSKLGTKLLPLFYGAMAPAKVMERIGIT